uniref:RING-type domain-containing protein n=1 Tax=Globodera pallida TaxID=36090 RepID=A0A183CPL5_GLOPA
MKNCGDVEKGADTKSSFSERHRRYATFGAQNFTLSSEVGEAHMAAFSELDEIIVGSGTSDALQQNDAQSCVICLGEIETGTVIKQLPCNHIKFIYNAAYKCFLSA